MTTAGASGLVDSYLEVAELFYGLEPEDRAELEQETDAVLDWYWEQMTDAEKREAELRFLRHKER